MPPIKITRDSLINLVIPILVALVFLGFVFLYFPFREKLQFDVDEGFNLIRSTLISEGYPLYEQVSSDQPPLFNYLLAGVIRTTGISVTPGRILVLLFSTLMVWALAQVIQLTWGSAHTILFLPLLFLTPFYMQLSVSIMIGLPAMAMASISLLFLILWHIFRRDFWLVLSGFSLGLSVLIKLFTGFLAPVFLIGMTIDQVHRYKNQGFSINWFKPAIIWGLSFGGLVTTLSMILVGPDNLIDIIQPHLTASSVESFRIIRNTINYHLGGFLPFVILGLLGILFTIINKRWLTLYPAFWALTAYLLLNSYSPVWYHQQLLVTVPVVMLGSVAAGEGVMWLVTLPREKVFQGFHTALSVLALVAFLFITFNAYPDFKKEIYKTPRLSGFELKAPQHKLNVYLIMREYASRTNWVVTDMPLYAFLIRKPVPPNLATFSEKRLNTGSLTEEEILETVKEYKPEQVLLVFFELDKLEEYLNQNYQLVHKNRGYRLYIRKDLE